MSVKKAGIIFLSTLSLAAVIGGCSSSSKEGAPGDVAKVGDSGCFQCHAATADPLTGETFIEQYQRSLHAELGCESCHGGGAQHNGVGPFPYTLNSEVSDAQKAARCAMCHDGVTQFTTNSGEVVVAPLSSSPNFQNGNHANPFSAEEAKEAKCARCHSHEGSILYGKEGFTGDKTIIDNTAYQPVLPRDPETFNTIKCATCHEHGGNIRQTKTRDLAGNIVTWDPNRNKVVDQFDICTSCHNLTTNEGKLIGSGNILPVDTGTGFANVSTAPYYHNTAWFRTLPSTHYDQPASGTTASGTTIEGYVMRRVGQTIAPDTVLKNPCFDCHGHEFKTNTRALAGRPERGTTIFTDWAQSGHAGGLLTQKVAAAAGVTDRTTAEVDAVMLAGATDASGIGWTHYNWDDSGSRGSCQRCHTSTGAANFLNNPNTYVMNGSGNSFTHLAGWTNSNKRSGQQELLYCWGCHSNAGTGKLRNPGAILHRYSAANYNYTIQFPDASGSNVCIACHTGRETGESIKTNRDADGVLSFVNSHYLTAGGQLYGLTGYEYAGLNYANPAFFGHDKIGSTAAAGTGTNGPCAGCHMKTANSHKFSVVSTNTTGVITKIRSQAACDTCHTGQYALTATSLETEKEEYEAALEATVAALASKGIYFSNAHPYFYNGPNGTGGAFTTWTSPYRSPQWKNVMGAAFNANLLIHDPGGYAHNRFYSKRLMWDSIDFIFNGVLDNDVPAAIDAQVTAGRLTAEVAAVAKAYLGTTRP